MQPGLRCPPPPPVVVASDAHATVENRDEIMEARLKLFPLCLYGAELTAVHKGLPYVFYQQHPASVIVVLDPQVGIRIYGEGDSRTIDIFFSRYGVKVTLTQQHGNNLVPPAQTCLLF